MECTEVAKKELNGKKRPELKKEIEAIGRVKEAFSKQNLIPCTGCRYGIEENDCPKKIRISDMFAAANDNEAFHTWNSS